MSPVGGNIEPRRPRSPPLSFRRCLVFSCHLPEHHLLFFPPPRIIGHPCRRSGSLIGWLGAAPPLQALLQGWEQPHRTASHQFCAHRLSPPPHNGVPGPPRCRQLPQSYWPWLWEGGTNRRQHGGLALLDPVPTCFNFPSRVISLILLHSIYYFFSLFLLWL